MINNELMNKDLYVVPQQAPIIIFDRKPDVCMEKNGKDIKHTRQISRIMHFVINGEGLNLHETVWCEGGLKLADIGTNNSREDQLNPILGFSMARLDN